MHISAPRFHEVLDSCMQLPEVVHEVPTGRKVDDEGEDYKSTVYCAIGSDQISQSPYPLQRHTGP